MLEMEVEQDGTFENAAAVEAVVQRMIAPMASRLGSYLQYDVDGESSSQVFYLLDEVGNRSCFDT